MDTTPGHLNANTQAHHAVTDMADTERIIDNGLKDLVVEFKQRDKSCDSLKEGTPIVGYQHEGEFNLEAFVNALSTTGFQATNMATAIEILRRIRDRNVPLYLGFTSNVGTCGLRETVTYLTKNHHVRALATSAGAIEEDVMKVFQHFVLGDFRPDDVDLFERSISRTGNIFIPSSRYKYLHLFLYSLNKRILQSYILTQGYIDVVDYVRELGHHLEILKAPRREESFVYWAYKNNIDLHCPALLDGAMGDALYWFQRSIKERFTIDIMGYLKRLTDDMVLMKAQAGEIALWAIGGSVPKHMICNSAIYAGGANYTIYVNTATEIDGSNAGAPINEAITWGKVRPDADAIKVEAEATLVVPLMVAAAYQCYQPRNQQTPEQTEWAPHLPELPEMCEDDVEADCEVEGQMEKFPALSIGCMS